MNVTAHIHSIQLFVPLRTLFAGGSCDIGSCCREHLGDVEFLLYTVATLSSLLYLATSLTISSHKVGFGFGSEIEFLVRDGVRGLSFTLLYTSVTLNLAPNGERSPRIAGRVPSYLDDVALHSAHTNLVQQPPWKRY